MREEKILLIERNHFLFLLPIYFLNYRRSVYHIKYFPSSLIYSIVFQLDSIYDGRQLINQREKKGKKYTMPTPIAGKITRKKKGGYFMCRQIRVSPSPEKAKSGKAPLFKKIQIYCGVKRSLRGIFAYLCCLLGIYLCSIFY